MKRSEMIEAIVYNCLSWDGFETSGVSVQEIANDILTHIEKMGMLPPTIEDKSFKILDNGEMIYQVNEWEPENE